MERINVLSGIFFIIIYFLRFRIKYISFILEEVDVRNLSLLFIVSLFFVFPNITVAQDSSLIAFWSFDDATAFDSSAYQNHGTLHGVTSSENRFGELNKAFYFDGIDDYISIDAYTNMNPSTSVSVAAWIKTEDTLEAKAIIYDRLETQDGFGLVLNDSGYPRLSINGGTASCTGTEEIDDQMWHFIVGTYSSNSEKIVIYIDAILSDTASYSDLIDYTPEPRNQIGRAQDGEDNFCGVIDEIRVYNRELNESEVIALYNNYTSVEEDLESSIIEDYVLFQNYPNPFNPSTVIKYKIPELSFVALIIYDVLGIEMIELVNEEKTAGTYNVEFNASSLPSGIYYYKLQAGEYTATKKMILLK